MSKDEVIHLARLANLALTDEELAAFATQLRQTIDYVDNLKELDTSNTEPTSHTGGQTNVTFADGTENTRGLTPHEATANSKKNQGGYFVVTRIM